MCKFLNDYSETEELLCELHHHVFWPCLCSLFSRLIWPCRCCDDAGLQMLSSDLHFLIGWMRTAVAAKFFNTLSRSIDYELD